MAEKFNSKKGTVPIELELTVGDMEAIDSLVADPLLGYKSRQDVIDAAIAKTIYCARYHLSDEQFDKVARRKGVEVIRKEIYGDNNG